MASKTKLHITIVNCRSDSIGAVRNYGIKQAKGDVLLFVDDDCIVPPNWVEQMSQFPRKQICPCALVGTSFPMYPRNVYCAANNYFPIAYLESIIYSNKLFYYSTAIDSKNFSVLRKNIKGKLFTEEKGLSRDDFLLSDKLREKGWMFLIKKKSIVLHKGKTNFRGFLHWSFEGGRRKYLYLLKGKNKKVLSTKIRQLLKARRKELISRLTTQYSFIQYHYFLILITLFHPLASYSGYIYEFSKKKRNF